MPLKDCTNKAIRSEHTRDRSAVLNVYDSLSTTEETFNSRKAAIQATDTVIQALLAKRRSITDIVKEQGGYVNDLSYIDFVKTVEPGDIVYKEDDLPKGDISNLTERQQERINEIRNRASKEGVLFSAYSLFQDNLSDADIWTAFGRGYQASKMARLSQGFNDNKKNFITHLRKSFGIPQEGTEAFTDWVKTQEDTIYSLPNSLINEAVGPNRALTSKVTKNNKKVEVTLPDTKDFYIINNPKIKTIFSKVRNILTRPDIDKVLEEEGLTPEEVTQFKKVLDFSRDVIGKNLPLDAMHDKAFWPSDVIKAPVLGFLKLNSDLSEGSPIRKYDENFVAVLGLASYEWAATKALGTLFKTDEEIKFSVGKNTSDVLHWDTLETLREVGDFRASIINELGKAVFDMLGVDISPIETNETAPLFKQQFITSLGLLAGQSMVNGGLLERNAIEGAYMKHMLGDDSPNAATGDTVTYRAMSFSEEEYNEPSDQLIDIINNFNDPAFKSALNKLTEGRERDPQPITDPIPVHKQPKIATSNLALKQKLTTLATGVLKKLHKQAYQVDAEGIALFKSMSKEDYMASMGYVKDLSKVLKVRHSSVRGKNRAIEKEYDAAVEFIKKLDRGNDEDFYFRYEIYKNNRIGMIENIINPQSNTLHRHLFKPTFQLNNEVPAASAKDVKTRELRKRIRQGIAGAFGFGTDKYTDAELEVVFKDLNENETIKTALKEMKRKKKRGPILSKALSAVITEFGANPAVFDGLAALASYQPRKAFTSSITLETDATTSGLSITFLQFASTLEANDLKLFAAAGFHVDGTDDQTVWKKIRGNLDGYQLMLQSIVTKAAKSKSIYKADIDAFLGVLYEGEIGKASFDVTSDGRNFTKQDTTALNYGASLETIINNKAYNFIERIYTKIQKNLENPTELAAIQTHLNSMLNNEIDFYSLEDITDFKFNYKQRDKLIELFTDVYAIPMKQSVKELFSTYTENKQQINTLINGIFVIFNNAYKTAVAKAVDAKVAAALQINPNVDKSMIVLSAQEELEVLESIKHLAPTFNTPFSATRDEGVLTLKQKKTYYRDNSSTSNVNTEHRDTQLKYNKEQKISKYYSLNKKSKRGEVNEGTSVSSDYVGSWHYAPEIPGASALTIMIQAIEASHMQTLVLEKLLQDIHDAELASAGNIVGNTIYHQEQIAKINSSYSLIDEVGKTFKEVREAYIKMGGKLNESDAIDVREAYNSLPQVRELSKSNKRVKSKMLGKGATVTNVVMSDTAYKIDPGELKLAKAVKEVMSFTKIHNQAVIDIIKEKKNSRLEAEAYAREMAHANSLGTTNQTEGIMGNFEPQTTKVSSKDTALQILEDLINLQAETGRSDSISHTEHLRTLMQEIAEEVLAAHDKSFVVNIEERTNGTEAVGRINLDTDTIDLVYSINPSTNRLHLSAAEVLTHETVHGITVAAMRLNPFISKEINRLHQLAKDNITWQQFLEVPEAESTQEEIKYAKERWDYIFESEKAVHEFVAFGNTNEKFMSLLEGVTNVPKKKEKATNLVDLVAKAFKAAVHYITGLYVAKKNTNSVKAELTLLTMKLAKTQEKHNSILAKGTRAIGRLNPVITKAGSDWIVAPLTKFGNRANPNIASRTAKTVVGIPALIRSKEFKIVTNAVFRNFDNLSLGMFSSAGNLLRKLPVEIAGATEDNWKFHNLIRKSKNVIDRARQKYKEGTVHFLTEAFNEPYSERESEHMYQSLLRTSMVDIRGDYTPEEKIRLLEDPEYLQSEIDKTAKQLAQFGATNARDYHAQAMGLGNMMAGKDAGIHNPMSNVNNIAKGYYLGNDFQPVGDTNTAIKVINHLKTLYALKATDVVSKKTAAVVMKREYDADPLENGIEAFFNLHFDHQAKSFERLFENDPLQVKSGFHSEITDPAIDIKFSNTKNDIDLKRAGYTMVDKPIKKDANDRNEDGSPKADTYMYVTNHGGLVSYVKTIVSLTANTVSGTTLIDMAKNAGSEDPMADAEKDLIKIKKRNLALIKKGKTINKQDTNLVPIMGRVEGKVEIVGYRYVMQESTRVKYLKKDNRIEQVLGAMYANLLDKQQSKVINKEVAEALYENYQKNILTNPKDFIEVSARADNKESRDIYGLIPDEMRMELKRLFGGNEFFMNQEYVDLIFGFRKMSLANAAIFKNVSGIVRFLEQIWQDVVGIIKNNIVIKTSVLTHNVISNFIVGFFLGVPIDYMIKAKAKATQALDDYITNERKISKLTIKLESDHRLSAEQQKKLIGARENLQTQQNESIVKPLIDRGLMSAIVEDISIDATTDKFGVSGLIEGYLDKKIGDKFPEGFKKAYGYAYLTKDNAIYQALLKTTQYSDFVARYAAYSHMTEVQGKDAEVAFRTVSDAFVNYDVPTSRELQYLNDMGLMVFTKYAIRIQKFLWSLAGSNPAHVLSFLALQEVTGIDPSDVTEAFSLTPGIDHLVNPISLVYDNARAWGAVHAMNGMDAIIP